MSNFGFFFLRAIGAGDLAGVLPGFLTPRFMTPQMYGYVFSGGVGCAVTAECLQMHGGIGMTDEFDIGLYLKRARAESVLFGDSAFHADRVATMLGY